MKERLDGNNYREVFSSCLIKSTLSQQSNAQSINIVLYVIASSMGTL